VKFQNTDTISLTSGVVCYSRQASGLNLFCFPYAGGGASVFRTWQGRLPDWVTVCAIQPPGRENRIREAAIANVHALVDELLPSIIAHADIPFAFMG
jgi:medium-chain acyl-[acyl-carrier-protein] hydrolase